MPEILLLDLIEAAMDLHGADGLWNGDGPCGCGRDDLNPGDCMSTSCVLAKSKVATEDDVDDCIEVGDVVWFPIQFKELPSTDADGFRTVLLAERASAKRDRLAMMADGIEIANQRDALAAEVVVLRTGAPRSPGAELRQAKADTEKYKSELERHIRMLSECAKERDALKARKVKLPTFRMHDDHYGKVVIVEEVESAIRDAGVEVES